MNYLKKKAKPWPAKTELSLILKFLFTKGGSKLRKNILLFISDIKTCP